MNAKKYFVHTLKSFWSSKDHSTEHLSTRKANEREKKKTLKNLIRKFMLVLVLLYPWHRNLRLYLSDTVALLFRWWSFFFLLFIRLSSLYLNEKPKMSLVYQRFQMFGFEHIKRCVYDNICMTYGIRVGKWCGMWTISFLKRKKQNMKCRKY